MSNEQIEINERVKDREPKNCDLIESLQRLSARQSIFD